MHTQSLLMGFDHDMAVGTASSRKKSAKFEKIAEFECFWYFSQHFT